MKVDVIIALSVAVTLAACQTTGPGFRSPVSNPKSSLDYRTVAEPIVEPIVIRYRPFRKSAFEKTQRTRLSDGKQNVDVTITVHGELEGVPSGDGLRVTARLIDATSNNAKAIDNLRLPLALTMEVSPRGELRDIRVDGPMVDKAATNPEALEEAKDLFRQLLPPLPEKGVRDGDNLIATKFSVAGGLGLNMNAWVLGKTVFDSRPALVVEIEGSLEMADQTLPMMGYGLLDIETAVWTYSEMEMAAKLTEMGKPVSMSMTEVTKTQLAGLPTVEPLYNVPSTRKRTISRTQIRPIAVEWSGYQDLIAGTVEFEQTGKIGTMKMVLPGNDGNCSGSFNFDDGKTGKWAVSCTNAMAAAGTFEAFGSGKGSAGVGKDTEGRRVRFTVGGGE